MAFDRLLLPFLSYLCAVTAILPIVGELPSITRLLLLLGGGGAVAADWREVRPPHWLLTLGAVAGAILALSRFNWANPVLAFVDLTVLLLLVRLLAEKNRRTYLQLFGLAIATLAATAIIRLDVLYLPALAVLLLSGIAALVILTARDLPTTVPCPPAVTGRLLRVALLLAGAALPLAALFFLILPRTQTPLWLIVPTGTSGSGFSEQVQPGKSSSQQLQRRVAFRAEVPAQLPPEQLYWRVTVLNQLTGGTWQRVAPEHRPERLRGGTGAQLSQTVFLEPGLGRFLVALDTPLSLTGIRASLAADGVLTSSGSTGSRRRYEVTSLPTAVRLTASVPPDLYRDLPAAASPRLMAQGQELQRQLTTSDQVPAQLEKLFLNQRLQYATTGMPTSTAPLDDFFFQARRGNCEYFAGSAAIILRAAGIPARLVGGYLGGEYSAVGSYYTVTDAQAHVWVEALLDGQWQRLDPSRWAINGGEVGRSPPPTLASRLRSVVDLADYLWTRTVISYDFQQQFAAADRLGHALQQSLQPASLHTFTRWAGGVLLVAAGCWFAVRRRLPSREVRLLRRIVKRLGHPLPPSACLLELARQTSDRRLGNAIRHYCATIYRDRHLSPTRYHRLRRLLAG